MKAKGPSHSSDAGAANLINGPTNNVANSNDSSQIPKLFDSAQQRNTEKILQSSSLNSSSKDLTSNNDFNNLNKPNKNVCIMSPNSILHQKSNSGNKIDKYNGAKEDSSDSEDDYSSRVRKNLSFVRKLSYDKINNLRSVNNITDDSKDDCNDSKEANNYRSTANPSVLHSFKLNKLQKTDVDTDDDADDEQEDDDNDDGDEDKKEEDLLGQEKNLSVKSPETMSVLDLYERFSRLQLRGEILVPGMETVKKSLRQLKISTSSEESSEDSDGESGEENGLARGPITEKGVKQSSTRLMFAPYLTPTQKMSRTPEFTPTSYPARHDSEDLNSIIIPHSEINILKEIPPEQFRKMREELSLDSLSDGLPNSEIKNTVNVLPDNSTFGIHSQYLCNKPINPSSELFDSAVNNISPEEFYSNQTHQNRSVSSTTLSSHGSLCSPDTVKSVDSVLTDNLKKTLEDELCTSDYGSPTGTNELSPAPSTSPENKNDEDLSGSLSACVDTFEGGSPYNHECGANVDYSTKMNLSREQKSFPYGNKNAVDQQHGLGSVTNIMPFSISQQHPSMHPQPEYDISYTNTKQACNGLPSATLKVQHIKPNAGAVFPSQIENSRKMVMHGYSVGQNISRVPGIMSGGVVKHVPIGSVKALNINSCNQNSFRRIESSCTGCQVYESNMQKRGVDRLLDMCRSDKKRSSILIIQWVTVLVETGQLDEIDKPLIIIKILKQLACLFGDKPMTPESKNLRSVWAEKFLASIICVNKLLKKYEPHIFITPDAEGNTPLRIAIFDNYKEPLIARVITDCIVKQNKNPDEVDSDGNSFLHLLCQKGESHVNVLAELLNAKKNNREAQFNVNSTNLLGETPLHIAVNPKYRSLAVVKLLLRHGSQVDATDCHNFTPLHIALFGDYDLEILRSLLDSPSCRQAFSIQDNQKNTPVMIAGKNPVALWKQLQAIQLFDISGANIKQLRSVETFMDNERREVINNLLHRKRK